MFAKRICFFLLGAAIILTCLGSTCGAADEAKLKAYGEHLSRECTTCHRLDGTDNGIPSIVGWDDDQFTTTLRFYQQGLRDNPAMVSVAKSLDEEQLRALAIYFASIKPPAKKTLPRATDRR
jgi:cytochrome c553